MDTTRIESLERQVRRLRNAVVLLAVAAAVPYLAAFARGARDGDGVLRARGLVIEDAAGRERILLGAPVPFARNRVRTDTERSRAAWASRFPPEYMTHYADYRHDMSGLLVLDEEGFDRVLLGDPVPDPNNGRRIGPSTGLAINDANGWERTGYGVVDVDGSYRVSLGFDSLDGAEGIMLSLFDAGATFLRMQDGERVLWLGDAPAGFVHDNAPFHGLALLEGNEVRHEVNVAGE